MGPPAITSSTADAAQVETARIRPAGGISGRLVIRGTRFRLGRATSSPEPYGVATGTGSE